MKILRLSVKDEQNIKIEFDNDQILFLSHDIVLKNGLRKNDEISEDLFHLLIVENKKYFIKKKSFSFLSRRAHSAFELKQKLRKKNYNEELIDQVLEELNEKKYLNDEDFAAKYVEEKQRLKKVGKNRLKSDLIKKGIHYKIIDKVLNDEFSETEMLENAFIIASKKYISLSKTESEESIIKLKISRYLFSKGYDFETIRDVIKKILNQDLDY
ncbi:MAG: hypothetical protein C0425_00640 [Chlorobiaceae bacterium]|nr:hypothetical protein [Chlorobiaceae bacterium]MBA4308829.1 hypothetical protein [Chlorobiaceae bacterium]